MGERRGGGARLSGLSGLAAVAATYLHFLIWAQFGLLARMRAAGLDAGGIRLALAAMGVAGLAASFAAARLPPGRRSVAAGLTACAVTALASLAARSLAAFALAAAAAGAATAVATVTLAAALPALVGARRRGLTVGGATGLAYLACNVPALFEARPAVQASAAAALCLAAAAALLAAPERRPEPLAAAPPAASFHGLGWAALVASFLALVWLDSAAFAIIQETETLRRLTWAPGNVKLALGAAHLVAALLAGWVVDRGRLLTLPPLAFAALAGAALALDRHVAGLAAGALYAAGVSLYSVPLVLVPAARLVGAGRRAAVLYGVAGWIGSALGVGMAQDLHRVPVAFLAVAGSLVALAALSAEREAFLRWVRRLGGALALAAAGALAVALLPGGAAGASAHDAVARGRAVYVAEGCVNCHSQYVRAGTRDDAMWGPARPLDRAARPPLPGNRRQGPDLAAVGLRRSAVWNRLHLIDPRALAPASRMPSYAHLFARGDTRGDDLVEYLTSLGAGDAPARLAAIERAGAPTVAASGGDARLYRALCAACHGATGRGDGPLAASFPRVAIDLTKPRLANVPSGPAERDALLRIVRWGIPGTSMAGHEALSDSEVGALADEVVALRARAPRTGTVEISR